MDEVKSTFVDSLFRIGAIQHGEFVLGSGIKSPIYADLRRLRSYPCLLRLEAEILWPMVGDCKNVQLIADVPTGVTPLVAVMSVLHNMPMITPREPKQNGTKAVIDGVFEEGMRVVVIDDVITTGGSVLSALRKLESAGLVVEDVCVLIDREQGGKEVLEQAGYKLHASFALRQIIMHKLGAGKKHEETMPWVYNP